MPLFDAVVRQARAAGLWSDEILAHDLRTQDGGEREAPPVDPSSPTVDFHGEGRRNAAPSWNATRMPPRPAPKPRVAGQADADRARAFYDAVAAAGTEQRVEVSCRSQPSSMSRL